MSDLKDQAYATYVSTHVASRKGAASVEQFRLQAVRWEKSLRPLLPEDRKIRIIDIGCGAGSVVWWLHQSGYRDAHGVDISAEQVAAAGALGVPNVRLGNFVENLADELGTVDVIMARDVFEHFDRPSLSGALRVINAALKPGGTLIFQVPNAESPFGGRIRYGDITHEQAFTSSSVHQLMLLTGFRDVRVLPVQPIVYGLRSWLRLMAWKVVQASYRLLISIEMGPAPNRVVSQNLIAVARR